MEVLILSKTFYGQQFLCVGGIVSETGQYLRLLNAEGWYQYPDTEFEIGAVWDISFTPSKEIHPPHTEDVIVLTKHYLRIEEDIPGILYSAGVPVWKGGISSLFDGLLSWTMSGSGYITRENGIPQHSVGFWIPDRALLQKFMTGERRDGEIYRSVRFVYPGDDGDHDLPYKGCAMAVRQIPAGTLVRVSLAKWWDTNGTTEERCALQLSGWYGLPEGEEPEDGVVMPF